MNDYEDALRRLAPSATCLTAMTTRGLRNEVFVRCTEGGVPIARDSEPSDAVFRRYALILLCENERLRNAPEGEAERLRAELVRVKEELKDTKRRLARIRDMAGDL